VKKSIKMFKLLILLVALPAIFALDFQNCPTGNPANYGGAENCDTLPCRLVRGENMRAHVHFTATTAATVLTVSVTTRFIINITVPIPVAQQNACTSGMLEFEEGGVASCPLVVGRQYYWHSDIPIPTEYPAVAVDLTVQLLTTTVPGFCLILPVQLA